MVRRQQCKTRSVAANAASGQVLTVYLQKFLYNFNKNEHTTLQPLKRKWTGPIDRTGKSHSA